MAEDLLKLCGQRDDPRPGWHSLRHTLARMLYGLTLSTDAVAEVLGHSLKARAGVTGEYIDPDPEAVRGHLEAAAKAILGEPEPTAGADAQAAPSVVVPFNRGERTG